MPSLVYQLDSAADATGIDFRAVKLAAAPQARPPRRQPRPPASRERPATQAAAVALPPGASVGPAGFPSMPFSFTFTGNFFTLERFLRKVDGFTGVSGKRIRVGGRLLTLDGISLTAAPDGFPHIKASISATAFLVPADQGLTGGATPTGPGDDDDQRDHLHRSEPMTRVRAIRTELVERKLWPVVLVLVIAAIALPIALGSGGGDKGTTAVPAAQSAVPANAQPAAVVSVSDVAGGEKRNRKGAVRDPFVQQHVAAAASRRRRRGRPRQARPAHQPDAVQLAGPQLRREPGRRRYAQPSELSDADPSGRPGHGAKYVYRVAIRDQELGKATGSMTSRATTTSRPRRTAMCIFVGVMADRKTAVFVDEQAPRSRGRGSCRPYRRFMRHLRAQAQARAMLLTLPQANGTVRRVRLTLAAPSSWRQARGDLLQEALV